MSDQQHAPHTSPPERNPVPIEQEAVCAPDPVRTITRKEHLITAAIRNVGGPARNLVSTATVQSQEFSVPLTVVKKYRLEFGPQWNTESS